MTDDQQAYYDQLSSVTSLEIGAVSVGLVESSKDVLIGRFELGQIDVDDIANIDKNGKMEAITSASAMIHEIIEQKAKQIDGSMYITAHMAGARAEEKITGWTRDILPTEEHMLEVLQEESLAQQNTLIIKMVRQK